MALFLILERAGPGRAMSASGDWEAFGEAAEIEDDPVLERGRARGDDDEADL